MAPARSWFRLFLAGWSLALLALTVWLASHTSSTPRLLNRYSAAYFALIAGAAAVTGASLLLQTPFLYSRLWRRRREILLLLGSGIVALGAVEAGLRLLDPFGLSYFRESTRYHLDKVADPILVYRHAPNRSATYQGVSVSTNELGLRERSLARSDPRELRILLLGDSVTFGWGVPVEATFGRRLEALLTSRVRRPVRTINSGVGSYNTVQELTFLATHHEILDPHIALLVYVSNDIEPNDPPFDPWSERSLVGKAPLQTIGLLLQRSWLFRLGAFSLSYARPRGGAGLDRESRGFKESMGALSSLARFCRARGMPFATFFYRGKPSVRTEALLREVHAVGEREAFPVIDVGAWWPDRDMRALTNSIIDSHPNAQGHEILARGMAEALLAHRLLDEPRAP